MMGQKNKARVKFWIVGLRYRLQGPTHTFRGSDQAGILGFRPAAFAGRQEYVSHLRRCEAEYEDRRQIMRELGDGDGPDRDHRLLYRLRRAPKVQDRSRGAWTRPLGRAQLA